MLAFEIRPISAADSIAEAGPLLREHWIELAKHREVMVLDPDVEQYRSLEAADALISLGAFVDGQMVGYSVGIYLERHLHYRGMAVVSNDVLFVSRAYRNEGVGHALMTETERLAKERGAKLVLWHAKYGTTLDALLFDQGYGIQDVIYGRVL